MSHVLGGGVVARALFGALSILSLLSSDVDDSSTPATLNL